MSKRSSSRSARSNRGEAAGLPSFREQVYELVRQCPSRRVLTYGQIAAILGAPRSARMVGGALHSLPVDTDVPWHRVVNRHGRISERGDPQAALRQAARLRAEGVRVSRTLEVVLKRYQWWPDEA